MAEAISSAEVDLKCVQKDIKKVKKKLKEIENLQKLDRNLNLDEKDKLNRKDELKKTLHQLLSECSDLSDTTINSDTTTNKSSMCNSFNNENHEDSIQNDCITSTPITTTKRNTPSLGTPTRTESLWCGRSVVVTPLLGHHDAVCSVDTNGSILMSGSRDTSIKLWDIHDFSELRSLGFHRDAVTGVKILPQDDELVSDMAPSEQNNCYFGISVSLDCHIVLWNLETGKRIQTIYTYNSIQCFEYSNKHVYIGSDGGKIDVWRIPDCVNAYTLSDCGCGITCMTLEGAWLYCGRTKGAIQVWNIQSRELCYDSTAGVDSTSNEEGGAGTTPTSPCCIRCICQSDGIVYYGDNGTNIKVLKRKTRGNSEIKKLPNHSGNKGSTGGLGICRNHDILVSAGYDMTTGCSLINLRRLSNGQYLCSIQDGSTSYISCMCVNDGTQGCTQIVTGGTHLKVIDIELGNKELSKQMKGQLLECSHIDELANNSYSTDVSTEESDQQDEDNSRTQLHVKPLPVAKNITETDPNSHQNSWCVLQ